jgi:GWxTD domain-containing protein
MIMIRRRSWVAISVLGSVLACAASDQAQPPPSGAVDLPSRSLEPPIFYVDSTTFLTESGASGVRVTVSVPYSQLNFSKAEGGGYEAGFELVAIFYDGKRRQVAGDIWRHQVTADSYRDTSSQRKSFSTVKEFQLPPGDYTLEVRLSGSTATRNVLVSPPVTRAIVLSAVEIGTCADSLVGPADPENAGFAASITRRFGEPLPWVCARSEVFLRQNTGVPLNLHLRVLGAGDKVEAEERYPLTVTGARSSLAVMVPVTQLGPGTYRFELTAEQGSERAVEVRTFEIDASRVNIERNYDDYVELARYYLGDEEVAPLRDVPEGERRQRWEEFWKSLDPDPDTPENEKLDEFLARVRVVSDRFAARGEPGWRSDRGKVYIRYGEPDDIEQVAQGFNSPAYEIWRYVNRNLTFVFADSTGFGDYVLVQPSNSSF